MDTYRGTGFKVIVTFLLKNMLVFKHVTSIFRHSYLPCLTSVGITEQGGMEEWNTLPIAPSYTALLSVIVKLGDHSGFHCLRIAKPLTSISSFSY